MKKRIILLLLAVSCVFAFVISGCLPDESEEKPVAAKEEKPAVAKDEKAVCTKEEKAACTKEEKAACGKDVKAVCTKEEKSACTKKTPEIAKVCPTVTAAEAGTKLIVIANQANYDLSKPVIDFIKTRGVDILNVDASKCRMYKKAKYMILLASPNDDDATGCMVKTLLDESESKWASQMGNKEMYLKTNKWADEQYILIFAGPDAKASFRVLVNNKNQWWSYLRKWFNIEPTHEEVYGY